jgi:hypothetical protein
MVDTYLLRKEKALRSRDKTIAHRIEKLEKELIN